MNVRLIEARELPEKISIDDVIDSIIHGDCLDVMRRLPSEIVDMVFFDPPYFLQLPKNKRLIRWYVKTVVESPEEHWDMFSSWEEYDRFITDVLREVRRLMKPDATIWAIGTYHNIYRIGKILQDLGFWILNDVIWFKTNPMPNWLNVRFTNATETLIWAVRDKGSKKYIFNHEYAREFSMRDFGSKISLNVWRIPISRGEERLKDENGKRLHPTQKPEELLRRIILVSTNPGDLILDPMSGTGTTGVVARRLRRHFIMIEREERYVRASLKRFHR
ncbi:MAG: site-specific DNA-methyltransferase [Desulfurococcales archaeon]|jgi:DNA modification methylase|nr:site-specific DNA-methyltransferase [Desulfurococcales archaeon]